MGKRIPLGLRSRPPQFPSIEGTLRRVRTGRPAAVGLHGGVNAARRARPMATQPTSRIDIIVDRRMSVFIGDHSLGRAIGRSRRERPAWSFATILS